MAEPQPDGPAASPDFLPSTARRASGVRRLNRVPILVAVGMASIIVAIAVYTVSARKAAQTRAAAAATQTAATPADPLFMLTAPENGLIEAASKPEKARPPDGSQRTSAPIPGAPTTGGPGREDDTWRDYRRRIAEVENQRLDREHQALLAETSMNSKLHDGQLNETRVPTSDDQRLTSENAYHPEDAGKAPPGDSSFANGGHLSGVNGQQEKRDFLRQGPQQSDYLRTGRAAPISPFELKAGTVIPGVMISGVNSDLPGQLLAQVSKNIFDTATGHHLLIPQGAKLVGTYDNGVTFGQHRILVVWRRIIYPDASSLDLLAMPGADESGYAGFKDKVNNHLFRLFGQAFLLSIFSAGIQLSSPQASNGDNYNSSQIIAGAIGQQLGQLGMEVVRRNMDIAPTLETRPGYIFNVMVTKDMVITPWPGTGTHAVDVYSGRQ